MKINNFIKIVLAILVTAALFVSCADIGDSEKGVLTINLPGSSARMLQPYFIDSLRYEVVCISGGSKETEIFSYGDSKPIALAPGKWDVTVNVLDVNDRVKGSMTKDVTIRAGKNTSVSFNKIEINDNEGKNTLFLKTGAIPNNSNKAGFDIVHDKTPKNNTNGSSYEYWNDVVSIEFAEGDSFKLYGRYPKTDSSISLSPDEFNKYYDIDEDGNFKVEIEVLSKTDLEKITNHDTTSPYCPKGIRVELGANSEVIIEQLLIKDKNGEVKLDFSDHLQSLYFMEKEELGRVNNADSTKFQEVFKKERHLIGANSERITFQILE